MSNHLIIEKIKNLFYNKQFKEVINLADKHLQVFPHDYQVLAWKAFSLHKLEKKKEAFLIVNQVIEIKPNLTYILNLRAGFNKLEGNYHSAIQDYNQIIHLDPNDAGAYHMRGTANEEIGDLDAALRDYNEAIRIEPNCADIYQSRGGAFLAKGDLNFAIQDYCQAIYLDPTLVNAFINRGLSYKKKGDLDEALRDYNEAILLDPKNADAYKYRGDIYLKRGNPIYSSRILDIISDDFDAALKDYNEAIRLDPNYADAYLQRGYAYYSRVEVYYKRGRFYDLSDLNEAISDYSKSIDLEPEYAPSYIYRGNAYIINDDLEAAIQDFFEAIRLDPKNANGFGGLGNAYFNKGNLYAAIREYNHALRLNPQDTNTINNLKVITRLTENTAETLRNRYLSNQNALKKSQSIDRHLQFFFDSTYQAIINTILPELKNEKFIEYWSTSISWGRTADILKYFVNSRYVIENAFYGAGLIALSDVSVLILSLGEVSNKFFFRDSMYLKDLQYFNAIIDFTKIYRNDHFVKFPHSAIQMVQIKEESIFLKTE